MNSPCLEVAALSREQFGLDFEGGSAPVEYLWSYLHELEGSSLLREPSYVDRHYLDDFTGYYARSFRVPPARCTRLHYFTFSVTELNRLLDAFYGAAGTESQRSIEHEIKSGYLGFAVRRPLKDAPIGRTVLQTYTGDTDRHFTVVRPYHVHIGALRLSIEGLAYQQQDAGAAVCASTALWCALQKVAGMGGHRTPTPSAITAAAESPYAASHGLTDPQMATALARLGYAADTFVPSDPALFKARVAACLRSNLPVVLMVGEDDAHAVTCTGYREPAQVTSVPPFDSAPSTIAMRTGSISTIYVHDDNLGSHAHYELHETPPEQSANGCYGLGDHAIWLVRGSSDRTQATPWWKPDCLPVLAALVPKPSKLRFPVDRLIHLGWSLSSLVELVFEDIAVEYDVAFATGVDYRRSMLRAPLARAKRREFDMRATLPRHLAIVSVSSEDDRLCDFLFDGTCIDLNPGEESLLAIVAPGVTERSAVWKRLVSVCKELGIPGIGAEPRHHESKTR